MSKDRSVTRDFVGKDVFVHNIDVFTDPIEHPLKSNFAKATNPVKGFDAKYNISFNTNSFGYRCDEFTDVHKGKHILFSGCSVTYGIGLDTDEIWSQKLFNKISKDEVVSGYFNLGVSGMGPMEIVSSIYKYIKRFGKPDYIFLNIPDPYRVYLYDNHEEKYFYTQFDFQGDSKLYQDAGHPKFILSRSFTMIAYQYLMMLEEYCKTNNIFLSYVNWSRHPELINDSDLANLYRYSEEELEKYITEYLDNNPLDKNIATARDGKHLGTGPHYAWSEMLYNIYKERVKV